MTIPTTDTTLVKHQTKIFLFDNNRSKNNYVISPSFSVSDIYYFDTF